MVFGPKTDTGGVLFRFLEKSQVHIKDASNVIVLLIGLFLEFVEELLGVGADLGGGTGADVVLYSVPVFAKLAKRVQEALVLLLGPPTFGSPLIASGLRVLILIDSP